VVSVRDNRMIHDWGLLNFIAVVPEARTAITRVASGPRKRMDSAGEGGLLQAGRTMRVIPARAGDYHWAKRPSLPWRVSTAATSIMQASSVLLSGGTSCSSVNRAPLHGLNRNHAQSLS
jgi:hypothetical protein